MSTARRATSWTRTRSSTGCHPKAAADRNTKACSGFGNLESWEFGNLESWEFGNLEIWKSGNLAGIEPRLTSGQLRKAALISATAAPLIRALGATYRWRVQGFERYESIVASGKQPIFAFWHGRILPATLFWKNRGIVVITSQNFDGEWIAGIIRRFGYGTARGSTSRGGARALVQLRRDLAAGKPAAFTVDGPRGPARVAQPGAVFLAGATGHPILPFHIECTSAWTMNSWDRTQIPKPRSLVGVAIGSSIHVPGTSEVTVESARLELEASLAALEHQARLLVGVHRRSEDQEIRRNPFKG